MTTPKVSKAFCYRVLVDVVHVTAAGERSMSWEPIIAADSPGEAGERAVELYASGPQGPGLPMGTATVRRVRLMHPMSLHNIPSFGVIR